MSEVLFRCSLSAPTRPLPHSWEHTVGSCHAPLALRADWQAQLKRCHDELGFRHVRFHGLLSDDMSTLVRHRGQIVYSFFNADRILDFLLDIGMRPFVELSFMPEAIASGADTVFSYKANVTPPADYREWAALISWLVCHWTKRYGTGEVRRWPMEVWNEPNLKAFWAGSQADYFKLYQHTAAAIKSVDPGIPVGGPATAANAWVAEFLDFCDKGGLPADFVSTHHYPNDPLWSEDQDTESELAGGERDVIRRWVEQVRLQAGNRPLYYTEWNISSNPRYPRQDEPYAAAFVVKTVLEVAPMTDCYSFWTFSDIFEENFFPSVPFHGGFGLLTIHGIPKPTYRAFELLHRLGTEQLPVEGSHATVDAWAVLKPGELTVVLTNHALPRQPIAHQRVRLELAGAKAPRAVWLERIDEGHANPKAAWQALGQPEYPDAAALAQIEVASRMAREAHPWTADEQGVRVEVDLPPHAVAALTLEFAA